MTWTELSTASNHTYACNPPSAANVGSGYKTTTENVLHGRGDGGGGGGGEFLSSTKRESSFTMNGFTN